MSANSPLPAERKASDPCFDVNNLKLCTNAACYRFVLFDSLRNYVLVVWLAQLRQIRSILLLKYLSTC